MSTVSDKSVRVTLVYSPVPRQVEVLELHLPSTSRVLDALQLSGLLGRFPEVDSTETQLGVWGRRVKLDDLLHDQDRLEVYRALRVDPKLARRERFVKQGSRGAGLFAKKRQGAKAGY